MNDHKRLSLVRTTILLPGNGRRPLGQIMRERYFGRLSKIVRY